MPVKIIRRVHTNAPYLRKNPKFTDLVRDCGELLSEVEKRLLDGYTAVAVAKWLKAEGKFPKTKLHALNIKLREYRAERVLTKLKILGEPDAKALALFGEEVDVLDNLIKLIKLQQTRVSKGLLTEEKSPLLDRKLRYEVALLGDLYSQLSMLRMDMGLIRRVPQKLMVEGMASQTQKLLEDAMAKNHRVDEALTRAFAVLEGKFQRLPDRTH